MRIRTLAAIALATSLSLGGCSAPGASADNATGGGNATAGGDTAGAGADGFEGSLVTSGRYAATWTASNEAEADVLNSHTPVTLASDRQTFANISVDVDGSISFGSAATELISNGSYRGSGAKVTLDKSGRFVCAFSVDTDLTGSNDGATLHIKGALTVRWHPEGLGDLSCP